MSVQFQLDRAGIAEILKSQEMADVIDDLAEQIAAGVRAGIGDPDIAATVDVEFYVTDRTAAAVTIAHVQGMPLQARQGVLTRAASAVGLDVKARP